MLIKCFFLCSVRTRTIGLNIKNVAEVNLFFTYIILTLKRKGYWNLRDFDWLLNTLSQYNHSISGWLFVDYLFCNCLYFVFFGSFVNLGFCEGLQASSLR